MEELAFTQEIHSRLAAIDYFDSREFIGLSDTEIDQYERIFIRDKKFPSIFRVFNKLFGKWSPFFDCQCNFYLADIESIHNSSLSNYQERYSYILKQEFSCFFVFADIEYRFLCFRLDSGDDPPIYEFGETAEEGLHPKWDHLSDYYFDFIKQSGEYYLADKKYWLNVANEVKALMKTLLDLREISLAYKYGVGNLLFDHCDKAVAKLYHSFAQYELDEFYRIYRSDSVRKNLLDQAYEIPDEQKYLIKTCLDEVIRLYKIIYARLGKPY